MEQVKLTAEQVSANRDAIHAYIIAQTKMYGGIAAAPVILLPEFEMDTDGSWFPVESNGVRKTIKEGLGFTRLGQAFLRDNLTAGFVYTNNLADEKGLAEGLELAGITIGSPIPGKTLIVEESLTPFRQVNPEQDIKRFPESNIPCAFKGEHNGIVYDTPAPIYRRVKVAAKGTEPKLIAHTNVDAHLKFMKAKNGRTTIPAKEVLVTTEPITTPVVTPSAEIAPVEPVVW